MTIAHTDSGDERQVKDNFIILQKLTTQTFSIAVRATDNVKKF
jgi:hypothetical protein